MKDVTGPRPDFRFQVIPYPFTVDVFWTQEGITEWCRRRGYDRSFSGARGSTIRIADSEGKWFLAMYLPRDASAELIYHECLHVVWDALDAAGVVVTADNHEVLAYTQGRVASLILNRLKKP